MKPRPFNTGCTPPSGSVLCGALGGFVALTLSGRGLTAAGMLFLLGGYALGALGGFLLIIGLGRVFGEWWHGE